MATFGKTDIVLSTQSMSANRLFGSKYTLSEDGTLKTIVRS